MMSVSPGLNQVTGEGGFPLAGSAPDDEVAAGLGLQEGIEFVLRDLAAYKVCSYLEMTRAWTAK